MRPAHAIAGSRAILDALDESAAFGSYLDWLRNEDVTRYLEVRFAQHDTESLRAYILTENQRPDAVLFGIFVDQPKRLIGTLRLSQILPVHRCCEVSLMIGDTSQWGKGVATEVVSTACRYAFETLGMRKVMAGCYDSNLGSLKAFLKAGFLQEGRSIEERLCDGRWVDRLMLGRLNPAMRQCHRDSSDAV